MSMEQSPSKGKPSAKKLPKELHLFDLQQKSITELLALCKQLGAEIPPQPHHNELVLRILTNFSQKGGTVIGLGVLEVLPDGFGFLRSSAYNYNPGPDDIYVSPSQITRFGLKTGSTVEGQLRPPKGNEKYFALLQLRKIEGMDGERRRILPPFSELTPSYPRERLLLETKTEPLSTRMIDLLAPLGKGQRGLIVAPPKAGKTQLLQDIANGIVKNHPETLLFILLIDERPEEVTEMRHAVQGKNAEIVASTFDEPPSKHMHLASMIEGKARRLVEIGKDVVILLDSLTRLARASNVEHPGSGKLLSGGLDAAALQRPKRFFGSARNIEGNGSLTILATTLIETGSRMDEVIFEEFKGTGNMEVVLSRSLAERRIFPAIDVLKTGTRREELLLSPEELKRIWVLRKVLSSLSTEEATELLLDKLRRTPTNAEFLAQLKSE